MAEVTSNVEFANTLRERKEQSDREVRAEHRHEAILEIFEALLLAIVAVSTAWSGYQAARWDGQSAFSYAEANELQIKAAEFSDLGGQENLRDTATFNAWLQARTSGNVELEKFHERRFSDDYEIAFKAWILSDPFNNPDTRPGPAYMPEYHNSLTTKAEDLDARGKKALEAGRESREVGEDYVRLTVLLALGLFCIAIAQRFSFMAARLVLLGLASIVTVVTLILVVIYPRM